MEDDDFVAVDKDGLIHDRQCWSHVWTSDQVMVGQRRGRMIDCMACVTILARRELRVSCMTCLVFRPHYGDVITGIHVDDAGVVHHTSQDASATNTAHIICLLDLWWIDGSQRVPWHPSVR